MSTIITHGTAPETGPVFEPLTVQQYHAMIASGILLEGSPIELIDGMLVRKDRRDKGGDIMTVGPHHATIVGKLAKLFEQLLQNIDYHARTQQPVTLSGTSEPEPDCCIVEGSLEDFASHHPGPAEIAVVIEVSDSSLDYDRGRKQQMYAMAGIPVYWIVNLRDGFVEVFDHPSPLKEHYDGSMRYRNGDEIPLVLGGQQLTVAVSDLL